MYRFENFRGRAVSRTDSPSKSKSEWRERRQSDGGLLCARHVAPLRDSHVYAHKTGGEGGDGTTSKDGRPEQSRGEASDREMRGGRQRSCCCGTANRPSDWNQLFPPEGWRPSIPRIAKGLDASPRRAFTC